VFAHKKPSTQHVSELSKTDFYIKVNDMNAKTIPLECTIFL
jgi:hypothetical protein